MVFFFVVLIFGLLEDFTISYALKVDVVARTIAIVFVIAIAFTVVAELSDKLVERKKFLS